MKKRIINSILCKEFNKFVESIKDENVKKLVEENTIITGGSIASMINNEEVKDFDLYFTNKETTYEVAKYYRNQFVEKHKNVKVHVFTDDEIYEGDFSNHISEIKRKIENECELNPYEENLYDLYESYENGMIEKERVILFINSVGIAGERPENFEEDREDPFDVEMESKDEEVLKEKYRPVFLSSNAITLSDKVQLIVRFYGDAETIHENFDYLHTMNYWSSKERAITFIPEAFEACHNKELIYQGSKYPLCSIIRMRKFIERGYTINAGEILKMALNLQEFDLYDPIVLKDQLVGVDSSYFNMLIQSVKNKEDISKRYLYDIINKLFN